jgi:hypothetical protein
VARGVEKKREKGFNMVSTNLSNEKKPGPKEGAPRKFR